MSGSMPQPRRTPSSMNPSATRPRARRWTKLAAACLVPLALAGAEARARGGAQVALAAPPSASPIRAHARAGERHPWLLTGPLSPPSARAPEPLAREALATHAPWTAPLELGHRTTFALGRGARVVAFDQRIDGVPVLGRGARVVLEADGRATTLSAALEERRPASMLPRVTAAEAERAARAAGAIVAERTRATSIVWPDGDAPRLAWLVEGATRGLPARPVLVIDAETGELLARWSATLSAGQAKVYPQNPAKTPTTSQVTIPATPGKEGLQNDLVIARNCIDEQTLRPVNLGQSVNLHVCDLIPTIAPDASGDYLAIAPGTDKAPEDAYAELSMFFHANRAWDEAKAMGFAPTDVASPLVAIANFRMNRGLETGSTAEMQNPKLALVPFDNAFFAGAGQFGSLFGEDGEALWFGQGTRVDFGYDGDVVYHEFGHFMVGHTLKLIGLPHRDAHGLSYAPGAMNEGIADLFSCFVTGDPYVGEYAGRGLGGKPIRSLDGNDSFPRSLSGEVHEDSLPFSQPIWLFYATLDAPKQEAFRRAFLEAMLSAPSGDLGYADFAKLLEASVSASLGADAAKALDDAFVARGIAPDEPRVIDTDGSPLYATAWYGFHAPSRSSAGLSPFAPGILQLRYAARPGSYTLHVTWNYRESTSAFGSSGLFSGGGKYVPQLLAKVGDAPISFKYGPMKHDAQLLGCQDFGDSVDCAVPVEVTSADGGKGSVYLMPVNAGTLDVDLDPIGVEAPPPPKPTDAGLGPSDGGDAGVNGLDGAAVGGAGCACDLPGAPRDARSSRSLAAFGAWSALSVAALVRRRRHAR